MKIENHLRAGFSLFWIQTFEPNRIQHSVYSDIENINRKDGGKYSILSWTCADESNSNPIVELNRLTEAPELSVLFLYNWHWFSDKPLIIQTIQNNIQKWANQGKAIICVSPVNKIPLELQKEFILFKLPLPNEKEIKEIILEVQEEPKTTKTELNYISCLAKSCMGLTKAEIENVLALSTIESNNGIYPIETINEHKANIIEKTGLIDIIRPNISFDDIIGYENLKQFIMETVENPKAKGIMAIGPPGCGKTSLMKAVIKETNRLGLSLNMGRLFSKFQGETDQNIDNVIQIISAAGKCIVLIDEFEKQFAGASSDGSLDSGTTKRATGRWLDFLQDRPEGVYIVGTANSFVGIPGEYLRPGRWDTSPFFIDLPTLRVREKIMKHYAKKAKIKPMITLNLDQFSGAEIEALVHIAKMRKITLKKALNCILPQAKTMKEDITKLRSWAKNRTISADIISNKIKRKIDV